MINDKMARMAVNTLKAYCDRKKCSDCAVSKTCDLAHDTFQYFAKYPLVGEFENTQKPPQKTPKFDATLLDSPCFRDYINGILELEAERAGISHRGLDKVKCYPNGTIKVWYTDDAFNPEIGIKLAVQRIAEKLNKPFIPTDGETYYYVDDKDTVYSTINHNTNRDILNIAVGNCFKNYQRALSNKDTITKRMEIAKVVLKTLREKGDE